jgi:hypothetical protein
MGEEFASGEAVISRVSFAPTPVLFWLKAELVVTEKRLSGQVPNTFLGLIPTGNQNVLFPLKQVAGLSVNNRVKPIRVIIGVLLTLTGLSTLGSSPFVGFLITLFGVALVLGGLTCALGVTNSAGSTQYVQATIFDKTRLTGFASKASQHLLDL